MMDRKPCEAVNPWIRHREIDFITAEEVRKPKFNPRKRRRSMFSADDDQNNHLDIYTKSAALKASPSIVCLQSYIGNEEIFQCSGTVIESDNNISFILTSASLLSSFTDEDINITVHLRDGASIVGKVELFDHHFNLAVIKVERSLPTALFARNMNDAIPVNSNELNEMKPFLLRPHQSRSFNLIPGDLVVALGRYSSKPCNLMAAPGEFCIDRCNFNDNFNCTELFRATCRIPRGIIGGPLVNRYAEVIGVCLHGISYTAFLPINVASLWWEHHKKYKVIRRPWLGMEATNLYTASLKILEKVIRKFPDVVKGVLVEEVIKGSSADSAGLKRNDVIFQLDGKRVQSFLELFESMWHKVGESIKLTVVRTTNDVPLDLDMVLEDASPHNLYRWPLLEHIP